MFCLASQINRSFSASLSPLPPAKSFLFHSSQDLVILVGICPLVAVSLPLHPLLECVKVNGAAERGSDLTPLRHNTATRYNETSRVETCGEWRYMRRASQQVLQVSGKSTNQRGDQSCTKAAPHLNTSPSSASFMTQPGNENVTRTTTSWLLRNIPGNCARCKTTKLRLVWRKDEKGVHSGMKRHGTVKHRKKKSEIERTCDS